MDEPLSSGTNPGPARIPVRSRRQAMDWSLVLMSQGITSTPDHAASGDGWELRVEPRDYSNALRILRQYHVENRGWPWHQTLAWPTQTTFHWGSIIWAAVVVVFYWRSSQNEHLASSGILNSKAVYHGEWWRLFTAILLHADLGHLLTNLSTGVLLLGLAMGRFGGGAGLLAAFLAGAGGNILALFLRSAPFQGLGSSGMITGALGLLAAQAFPFRRSKGQPWKPLLAGFAAGIMLFVLFGLSPGSDVLAHLGGFLSGLLLGAGLSRIPARFLHNTAVNLLASLLLFALVLVTWWLAVTH